MKRASVFILVLCLFAACKKEEGVFDDSSVVGKWKFVRVEIVRVQYVNVFEPVTGYFDEEDYLEVFPDSTAILFVGGNSQSSTWRLGNLGKRLILTDADTEQEYRYDIKTLTKSSLVLYSERNNVSTPDFELMHTEKATTTFSR